MHPLIVLMIICLLMAFIGLTIFIDSLRSSTAEGVGFALLVMCTSLFFLPLLMGVSRTFSTEEKVLEIQNISRTKDGFTTFSYKEDNIPKFYVSDKASIYLADDKSFILKEIIHRNVFKWKNSRELTIDIDIP
jgi:hypothetical protein